MKINIYLCIGIEIKPEHIIIIYFPTKSVKKARDIDFCFMYFEISYSIRNYETIHKQL